MRAKPAGPLSATTSTVTPYSDSSIRRIGRESDNINAAYQGPVARRTPHAGAAGSPVTFAVPGFAAARNAAATGYQGIMDASAVNGHDPGFAEHLTGEDLRAWQREHLAPAQRARDITVIDS